MKNIIVTGASRGIGFALVKYLAEKNHNILAISRDTSTLLELQKKFSNIIPLQIEITSDADIKRVSKFVEENWAKVDALVHNAGKLIHKPFVKTSYNDFLEVFNVNIFAVAELTKAMLPFLHAGAHVVAISSIGGVQGSMKFGGLSAYSSSKGALTILIGSSLCHLSVISAGGKSLERAQFE